MAPRQATSRKRANGDARPYYDRTKDLWKVAVELDATRTGRRRRKIVAAKTPAEARALARRTREKVASGVTVPTNEHQSLAGYLDWEKVVLSGTVSDGQRRPTAGCSASMSSPAWARSP